MTNQTPKVGGREKLELYGVSLAPLLNRLKYKGRGRPKHSDYFTLQEAQQQLNQLRNNYLDHIRMSL